MDINQEQTIRNEIQDNINAKFKEFIADAYESVTTDKINLAFIKFQEKIKRVAKDKQGQRSMYATWEAVAEHVKPALSECELSFKFFIKINDDKEVIHLRLQHSSNQWYESRKILLPANKNDCQQVATYMTYTKRILLCALLGLTVGEVDDDGESNSQTEQENPHLNEAQLSVIRSYLDNDDAKKTRVLKAYDVTSLEDLYYNQAEEIIKRLRHAK